MAAKTDIPAVPPEVAACPESLEAAGCAEGTMLLAPQESVASEFGGVAGKLMAGACGPASVWTISRRCCRTACTRSAPTVPGSCRNKWTSGCRCRIAANAASRRRGWLPREDLQPPTGQGHGQVPARAMSQLREGLYPLERHLATEEGNVPPAWPESLPTSPGMTATTNRRRSSGTRRGPVSAPAPSTAG